MPHLREFGYEAVKGDDDAPRNSAVASFGGDRDGQREHDEGRVRESEPWSFAPSPHAAFPHD